MRIGVDNTLGQQKKPVSKPENYPTFFKLYSKDGRESLTATCTPTRSRSVVDQVTCKLIHVRFQSPSLDEINIPLSVEEALEVDPNLAEDLKKNPSEFEQELRKGLEKAKQDFCLSKQRVFIETKIHDPEIGPKRKFIYQQLLTACADKDPTVFFQVMRDFQRRTCDLWVDQFTLDFRKVREGQWLYRQETPGLLSKALKIYELTGDGVLWTLSETRVPTGGSEEEPAQIVWSWQNTPQYELPCDFITHHQIQFP